MALSPLALSQGILPIWYELPFKNAHHVFLRVSQGQTMPLTLRRTGATVTAEGRFAAKRGSGGTEGKYTATLATRAATRHRPEHPPAKCDATIEDAAMKKLSLPIVPAVLACAALAVGGAMIAPVAADQQGCGSQGIARAGCVHPPPSSPTAVPKAVQLLERTRAAYAALGAYADAGTLVTEEQSAGAPMMVERHRFDTAYRAPRQFFFDFEEDQNAGGDRFVIWCEGDRFQSWWATTGVHEVYPQGQGATAFALGMLPTRGSAALIPALLFASAGLQGPLTMMQAPRYAGAEEIEGRRMHKLAADVRLNHWSETTRPTTIWIDAETYLVRKIVEDTPTGQGAGSVQRTTATFEPQANPDLDDARFRFEVPAQ